MTRSYKVGVKTAGDKTWSYNMLRFPTREAAQEWGDGLALRWTAVTAIEVHKSEDEVNR